MRVSPMPEICFIFPSDDGRTYNVAQRMTYLVVIFGLFPLVIWTGLAMSPAFTSAIRCSRSPAA